MKTVLPENLADLDLDVLEELKTALHAEFDQALEDDAEVALLSEIADAVDAVKSVIEEKEQTIAAEKAKKDELVERMKEKPADDDGGETEITPSAEAEEAEEKEPIMASGKPPAASAVKAKAPAAVAPPAETPDLVITASADVPGFANGQTLDRLGIANALHARARGLGDSQGRRTPFGVASIQLPIPQDHFAQKGSDMDALIDTVVREKLAGQNAQSLVASGGWCAPAETLYDFFSIESRDGLLDLPTLGVTRGGVTFSDYVGLSGVASALWTWTAANDETPSSPATKPCLAVPCPTTSTVQLDAEGLCLTHGNLMDRAWPEATARFVDLTITAHLHRLSTVQLAIIVASADAVTVTGVSDAAGDLLNAIDLQVADYRSEHTMGLNSVLDAIMPFWALAAVRATLAMRNGVDMLAVTDAQILGYFTARNIRPQFLHGYEPLFDTNPATGWPASMNFLLFPAGGYVALSGGTLDLGVIRDSTLNETNDFTLAWTETFHQVIQRGPVAREVTVDLDVDGGTGSVVGPQGAQGPQGPQGA